MTYVFDFADGGMHMKDLLGGKGANLAEMTRLGLPVPPGFTITTEACRAYLKLGELPEGLLREVGEHLLRVEQTMGRRLGDPADPLLLSVRSGGKFSMPGMMETILDVGLNDITVTGLAATSGDDRFAWDCYRRLISMYGATVEGVPRDLFERALAAHRRAAGVRTDPELDPAALRALVEEYKQIFQDHTGEPFPQDPATQLKGAILAVLRSWNTERARVYRRAEHIPDDLGTAVNIMAMVYGNRGPRSGTGVAFTRDPATGARGRYGDYLPNAQGEDVVSGSRDTLPLQELAHLDPPSFDQLTAAMRVLEQRYRDLCDIEFTIEEGRLWMLQTRVGKRTAAAAFTIAGQLVDEGVIDLDEALRRVDGAKLAQLMFPRFDLTGDPEPIVTGVAAAPGASCGRAVFDSRRATEASEPVILIRRETNPDDLPGMLAARGILTSRGGKTSHAAVVARGMGRTCVCGTAIEIDDERPQFRAVDVTVREGDLISIDGTTGKVYLGELPVRPSPVVQYFEGERDAGSGPLVAAVHRLVAHADAVRRLGVYANADTPEDAARARRFGAAGIGLCRTEHMFLGERRALVERLILAEGAQEVQEALVGDVRELHLVRADAERVLAGVPGIPRIPIGTMIEVPRAALTAGDIAGPAEFFSFGTNDLTQMAWGFSRDDVEGSIFPAYLRLGVIDASPFETIDRRGVGRLVSIAVKEGRQARPDLRIGVCGEHGGDPDSVRFFHEAGLDYVSCSPFRVPVARLEAGRAALPADT
ncbi:hypothetical protein GCM10009555_038640 [Acrocarpospora macrocephala]|uniref:Pyruvate, phosphate dikinase n=1 Tax=Acrocarpospora macrocephala TaxID=150177 RepID=A0A5M3WMM6_9ACTN|nr:pyruvate, phosphate dikinase [Acrocarpospora macrocephala]GES09750.1 hypothetical protein Amac_033460 [Acrocarpospora macrocephala]